MKENKTEIRKNICMDEELFRRCEILYGLAGVENFSAFARQALEFYIDQLVADNHGVKLTEAIQKAVHEEVYPIESRISKALDRYAVILDALIQIVGWRCRFENGAIDRIHKDANRRVAQMKGRLNLRELLNIEDKEE